MGRGRVLGRDVKRGEVWLAQVGRKPRPVLVVTRDEVLDVRANVTVAEITTHARGLTVEVPIGPDSGIDQASVVNCDGLHTVSQRRLTTRLGSVDDATLEDVCQGIAAAVGCDAY
jgi:mRNA interferase MazF